MIPILITAAVVIGALGVVYVVGAQPAAKGGRGKQPVRGRTTSSATRAKQAKQKKVRSPFHQPPKWIRRLPVALLIAALVCLGVALAQFRVSKQQSTPVVALVLDASDSMNNNDVSPTRLAAAVGAARLLIEGLPPDFEVTLVSFASTPTVIAKPTTDHAAVTEMLKDLPRGRGTVIGDGLSTAIDQIQNVWAERRTEGPAAIVLLSDGKDTGSRVLPLEAAQRASDAGIPVHTVVLGMPGPNGKGADADLLDMIASETGGSTASAVTASQLASIYGSLGSQLSLQLSISSSAQLFVILAIALAVAAAVILLLLTFQRQSD